MKKIFVQKSLMGNINKHFSKEYNRLHIVVWMDENKLTTVSFIGRQDPAVSLYSTYLHLVYNPGEDKLVFDQAGVVIFYSKPDEDIYINKKEENDYDVVISMVPLSPIEEYVPILDEMDIPSE